MTISEILKNIYETNVDLLKGLRDQKHIHQRAQQIDVSNLYQEVHRYASPCFVLSTGRCGTKLLTKILKENSTIRAFHVPTPEFTHYAEFAYNNTESESDIISRIVDSARYEQIRDTYLLDKQYVETNNRITFFCHALAELYPKSTFLHLVRKPEEFIRSGLARNWYSGSVLYDEGRIQPKQESFSQVEKIAWLWNETNTFIEEFKKGQPSDRVLTIRSEDLFHSVQTAIRIFNFLKLEPPEKSTIQLMIRKPVNKQSKDTVPEEIVTEALLGRLAPLRYVYFNNE